MNVVSAYLILGESSFSGLAGSEVHLLQWPIADKVVSLSTHKFDPKPSTTFAVSVRQRESDRDKRV